MRTAVYVRILFVILLGQILQIADDGSVLDYNIYNQSSQWGMGLIAHDLGEGVQYKELEIGDSLFAYTNIDVREYVVVSKDIVSADEWRNGVFGQVFNNHSTDKLYLYTCEGNGVIVIKLMQNDSYEPRER